MAAKKTTKKAPAKSSKKVSAKKTTKKVAAKKPAAKKAAAKKTLQKKKVAKKAPAKKAAAKKVVKKTPVKASKTSKTTKKVVKKAPVKKPVNKKTVTTKTKPTTKQPAATKPSGKNAKPATATKGSKKVTKKVVTKKASATTSAIPASLAKKLPPIKKLASPFRSGAPEPVVIDEEREWTVADLKKVKSGLNKRDLEYFRKLLIERRAEILGSVSGMESAHADRSDDSSSMPLHMADIGSENFDQEFNLGLMESERRLIIEINEAIQRIHDGYYGVCLESGRPINRERLEAKPWAKYTIEVARERERRGLSSG
ncbi:TraR/DksA family transcriptional regulator [Mucisphaera sp.]|uniref:TraR/DksA family transcriptional regulator n=1 Tax=Mucisphaera sp. TaxID=2913024 RepID=UPI003D0C7D47